MISPLLILVIVAGVCLVAIGRSAGFINDVSVILTLGTTAVTTINVVASRWPILLAATLPLTLGTITIFLVLFITACKKCGDADIYVTMRKAFRRVSLACWLVAFCITAHEGLLPVAIAFIATILAAFLGCYVPVWCAVGSVPRPNFKNALLYLWS